MSHFSASSHGMAEAGRMIEGMNLGPRGSNNAVLPPPISAVQYSSSSSSSSSAAQGAYAPLPPAEPPATFNGNARRVPKRQMSSGTYELHTPAPFELKAQRLNTLTARKPGVVPNMWTAEEDRALQAAVSRHGEKNWRAIADDIPRRNHLQCLQRWKKALRPGLVKGHWAKDEDDLLLDLISAARDDAGGSLDNVNWASIAAQIDGRNAKQCRERWCLNLDPSINRGPWTAEEDARLMRLATECAGRWALIAKNMEGRTENSVKTRFHSLQRQQARTRGWTGVEDDTLLRTVLTVGRDWGKVIKQLPGRSRGQAKKRFATLTQGRAELVAQVQDLEARIEHGELQAPNPPPAPVAGPAAHMLHGPQGGMLRVNSLGGGNDPYGSGFTFDMNDALGIMPEFGQQDAPQMQHPQGKGVFPTFSSAWIASPDALDADPSAPATLERTNSQLVLGEMIHRASDGREAPTAITAPAHWGSPPAQQQHQHQPFRRASNPAMRKAQQMLIETAAPDPLAVPLGTQPNYNQQYSNVAGNRDSGDWALPPLPDDNPQRARSLRAYKSWGSATGGGPEFAALYADLADGNGPAQQQQQQQQQNLQSQQQAAWQAEPLASSPVRRLQKAASSGMGFGLGNLASYDSSSMMLNMI